MSAPDPDGDRKRLDYTLSMVAREAEHLAASRSMVFEDRVIDTAWVEALHGDAAMAAFVEAFASRFSRMQDTIIDRLLPRLLTTLGERPGSAIDNLNRAEQLDWIDSAADWKITRTLRPYDRGSRSSGSAGSSAAQRSSSATKASARRDRGR